MLLAFEYLYSITDT